MESVTSWEKREEMLLTHQDEVEKDPGLDSREGHVLEVVEAKGRY